MLVGERVRSGGINCARKMLHCLVCDDEEAIRCDSCCEVRIAVIKVDIDVDVFLKLEYDSDVESHSWVWS